MLRDEPELKHEIYLPLAIKKIEMLDDINGDYMSSLFF
jgi:hypothetical protein